MSVSKTLTTHIIAQDMQSAHSIASSRKLLSAKRIRLIYRGFAHRLVIGAQSISNESDNQGKDDGNERSEGQGTADSQATTAERKSRWQ